ncbi:hypothetical protein [Methylomagnum ishizawai]|uniref:hypothetical protein n=1 Tax=Methylomagnum ishizawai TaxID=1760988 RepID=UPI001C323E16|nr:hypothetical protein [Methylomagnum ishizawai]BBL73306.1 hypothetical protein MishRS11D_04040 [Methylomagnum ishizawai]
MRNRTLPFGLIPALLGSVLMFATADLPAQETATTTPASESTTTQTTTEPTSTATDTSAAKTAAACTKRCIDISGNYQSCKNVNNIPMYTCTSPNNICSGACF